MLFPGKCALLIIDAQQGFADAVFGLQETVEKIGLVLGAARQAGIPIIHSQEMHRADGIDFGRELDGSEGIHCLEGTPDVEILDPLQPLEGEYRIRKRRYSVFFGTDLGILLRGLQVDTLIVCGFLTDVCVHYTCADAHQHDYYIRVMQDGVSGSSPEAHAASLAALSYLQRDALVSAEAVAEFLNSRVPV